MAAKKKPSFYHTRNKICPNNQQAAELLGVDISETERMDKEGAPVMAERLLLLWDRKYINSPGWDGWVFSRGVLIHKNKRWRPESLLQIRKDAERIEQLENEIYKLHSPAGLIKIIKKILLNKYGVRISRLL
ncbi:hypothetical protein V3O24_00755 [Methylobacter sp. Wu8]|uniref:hypothetical protein n=1 Tax=Methylobacter sp. Wu8 TaxID=3118457 RepID=UPI002F320DC3